MIIPNMYVLLSPPYGRERRLLELVTLHTKLEASECVSGYFT